MKPMKALVLSCDRYHPFAEHMICTYRRHWPDHPFTFHIPFQVWPTDLAARLGDAVRFIEAPAPIRSTLDALLDEVDDDEWIYWCIDDKYLIELDRKKAAHVAAWVSSITDPTICGVSFARARRLQKGEFLNFEDRIVDSVGGSYFRRVDFSQIWLHQFLRARVLKHLFAGFPDDEFAAKAMDAMVDQATLPTDQRLYVSAANHVVFGESTSRAKLTENCALSLDAYRIRPPPGIDRAERSIIIGKLPPGPTRRDPLRRLFDYLSRRHT